MKGERRTDRKNKKYALGNISGSNGKSELQKSR